ncbi:hypothetical protein, partial [Nostoc sp.]
YVVASLQEMGIAPNKKIILFSYCLRKSCKQCPILLFLGCANANATSTLLYFNPSLRDATRSLLPRSGTASSGHRATRSLLPRSGTAKLRATRRSVPFSTRRYANGKLRAGKVSTSAQCPANIKAFVFFLIVLILSGSSKVE